MKNRIVSLPSFGGAGVDLRDHRLAVVDIEGSGTQTGSDRIVEIAIVTVNSSGRIIEEWSTMIDPKRTIDWNGGHVHHITNAMVRDAPTFETVAGDVLSRLDGAILVAHNISYEDRLLAEEFRRLKITGLQFPALCTWRLAKRVVALESHRLGKCCSALSIPLEDAHT